MAMYPSKQKSGSSKILAVEQFSLDVRDLTVSGQDVKTVWFNVDNKGIPSDVLDELDYECFAFSVIPPARSSDSDHPANISWTVDNYYSDTHTLALDLSNASAYDAVGFNGYLWVNAYYLQ